MMSLAVKYRPKRFDEVCGQDNVVRILTSQIENGDVRNVYLFTGSAGCGKTTCARIFANGVNHGLGNPLELDGASNNSVDDVRQIISQAKLKSLDSEYKVFIIDECHALSNSAWQAMLKLIEEPPMKTIFIFCTTDPQKIPKTILSRVQRYDFRRISQSVIVRRLEEILTAEGIAEWDKDAVDYIGKLADGGLRDAITLLDKCLAYDPHLSVENVVKTVGTTDFVMMIHLTNAVCSKDFKTCTEIIEELYDSGKDIKVFVKSYTQFLIDIKKYVIGCDWQFLSIPRFHEYEAWLDGLSAEDIETCTMKLELFLRLEPVIRYSSSPKYDVEAILLPEVQL